MLGRERRPGGIGGWPLLEGLGDASYSIYLWHTLGLSVSARVAHMLGLPVLPAIALHVATGLAVGLAGYALVERPMIRHFAARRRRLREAVAGAA